MLLQHHAVIHLVNVIAGKNQHVLGLLRADGINVLVDRVGRALVPLVAHPLHRRQHFDELAHFAAQDVPAFADVPVQRERLVLGEDVDPAQVGVEAVGKRDVDDAVDAAEGDGRLGAVASERIEPLAGAACQENSESIFHSIPSDFVPVPTYRNLAFSRGRCEEKTVDGSTAGYGC